MFRVLNVEGEPKQKRVADEFSEEETHGVGNHSRDAKCLPE